MKIKEIIIDGFKSYANRTVIRDFDPSFNAITGLNGSGKSNILDSICFVLGLSNLSHVRVSNLQQLIYKQGQSRVTKASVTIVFDNSDPAASPYGFKDFKEITVTRQIMVGGKGKYLLNGSTAQLSRIKNLFESVQLNVNNPHFLIMQGRITKVINMKPVEILGMIQEAAGTRMYERQKEKAEKTIEAKQIKVNEINTILLEEIMPQMEKLRKERSSFIKWSANKTELERLERSVTAWRFVEAEQSREQAEIDRHDSEARLEGIRHGLADTQGRQEDLQAEVERLSRGRAEQMHGAYTRLEEKLKQESLGLVKVTSEWENRKKTLQGEQARLEKLRAQRIVASARAIEAKRKQIDKAREAAQASEAAHKELTEEIASLQGQLLGVRMAGEAAGGAPGGGEDKGSLADQLMQAEKAVSKTQGLLEQSQTRRKLLAKELAGRQQELKGLQKQSRAQQQELEKLEAALEALRQQQARLAKARPTLDAKARARLVAEIAELEERLGRATERLQMAEARSAQWAFEYQPPQKNWDRRRVKGLVAELARVADARYTTAVEVIAGGRLFNVVVDTQDTGKLLLEKGRLRRRVTIIPLNKIAARRLEQAKLERAEQIVGKDNVVSALSVVGYDEELEKAMEYVFGGAVICASIQAAEQVAYHPELRLRSVTLEGDTYDPQGSLTGGSKPGRGGSILEQMQEFDTLRKEVQELRAQLESQQARLQESDGQEREAMEMQQQVQLQEHNLGLTKARLGQSQFAQVRAQAEQLEAELQALDASEAELKEELRKYQQQAANLGKRIAMFEKERSAQRKECQKQLNAAKAKLQKLEGSVQKDRDAIQVLELELQQLTEEHEQLGVQASQLEAAIGALQEEFQQLEQQVDSKKQDYDRAQAAFEAEKTRISQNDQRIAELGREIEKLAKSLTQGNLEVKKLQHAITRLQQEAKEAGKRVSSILKQNRWIAAERQLFGQKGTDYDFDALGNMKKVQQRLTNLVAEQADLEKHINKKVMGMFERAEQEASDLMAKRDIILRDKDKIEEVIVELDRKKNEALDVTWKKVNGYFSSIFSTLLPGAHAKLQPPEDAKTILDGLEVRVGFGGVWKQSLSELSGGQRSLLALSLILAMLRFKPAPMYILDEIDAALDLSHTQNIGMMLKQHFPQSQFIVVSLKEGMFNNANVIFRTEFVDGVSAVKRTVPGRSQGSAAVNENEAPQQQQQQQPRVGNKRVRPVK